MLLATAVGGLLLCLSGAASPGASADEELRPKHVTADMLRAVKKGLDYLARTQASDGSWSGNRDGSQYPISMTGLAGLAFLAGGNTPSRGPYADQVRQTMDYLMQFSQSNGLITGPAQEIGRPMYGHGFALTFFSVVYGMENNSTRRGKLKPIITNAVQLTAAGQSNLGGWTYYPGGGDEGSVTVTQIQALRAAHLAGFTVPEGAIKEAVRYLERCRTPAGGIRYSAMSGPDTRLPITAAAVATLYNAGEYDSEIAEKCLEYVWKKLRGRNKWSTNEGHDFYTHLYAAQAFYAAGDKYWDEYFPSTAKQLMSMQKQDGSWDGDGIGPTYGTSIALIILQLPYKFLPIYQR